MRAFFLSIIFMSAPALGLASDFTCYVNPLMGADGEVLKISESNPRVSAENLPIACGLVQSASIIFCLKGNAASPTSFKTISDETLLQTTRTDVNNEWVQGDISDPSFMAKFLDGAGPNATGYLVSCKKN